MRGSRIPLPTLRWRSATTCGSGGPEMRPIMACDSSTSDRSIGSVLMVLCEPPYRRECTTNGTLSALSERQVILLLSGHVRLLEFTWTLADDALQGLDSVAWVS